MNLGNLTLALALASGVTALCAYGLCAWGQAALRRAARIWTVTMALAVVAASVFQMRNIVTHQFQYEYVTNFSDRALPPVLLAASFWAGQAGSFMLWALWSVLFALVLMRRLRRSAWEPFVLGPYLLVTSSIIALTWAAGPFRLLAEYTHSAGAWIPADGRGLNPLLQNYWMAIHPPILFTGFTTMAAPFAFAVAALWKRDYDGWVPLARPWILLAWVCLGAGLALGGFWAYESLGWGGFWGWDPVENASLVPWLFAGALIHGLVLQGARGSMKRSNLFLAITGYLLVVYSTFLTRSGILGNFSVHSFVELGLMGYLVGFLGGTALLGFGLLAWRWRSISRRVVYTTVVSREFGLLVSTVLFIVIALIVGVGTSMPVISRLPGFASQVSIDLGFYGPAVAPFGLLLLLTMAVGPLLGWQRSKYGSLRRALRWPARVTALTLVVCLLIDILYPVALLFITAAVFAATTNAMLVRRIWRAGPLKLGGYLCHIGVGLLFVGIVGTSLYKQTAALQLLQDTPQMVFGRQFTFRGLVMPAADPLRRTAVQVEVTDPQDGRTWVAEAPYYVYPKTGQLVIHPAIQSRLWDDLYLAPGQYQPPPQAAPGLVYLGKEQRREVLGYTLTFKEFRLPGSEGALEAMLRGASPAAVEAVVMVTPPEGATTTVIPRLRVRAGRAPEGEPVTLPGGATLTITALDPASQMVAVQLGGLDLSKVNPDDLKPRLFIEVSREPGIRFVWGGILIGVLGGLLALLRRWREARSVADPEPGAVPRPRSRRTWPVLQPEGAQMLTTAGPVNTRAPGEAS